MQSKTRKALSAAVIYLIGAFLAYRSALAVDLLILLVKLSGSRGFRAPRTPTPYLNMVVAKPSIVVTKSNIAMAGMCVRGGAEKEIKKTKGQICIHVTTRNITCNNVMIR